MRNPFFSETLRFLSLSLWNSQFFLSISFQQSSSFSLNLYHFLFHSLPVDSKWFNYLSFTNDRYRFSSSSRKTFVSPSLLSLILLSFSISTFSIFVCSGSVSILYCSFSVYTKIDSQPFSIQDTLVQPPACQFPSVGPTCLFLAFPPNLSGRWPGPS